MMTVPILDVRNLSVGLQQGMTIVDDVSFSVAQGQTVCLVGESGSGKSMIANAIMDLLPSSQLAVTGGQIRFRGG